METSKQTRLEEIVLEIQRKWGKNSITTLSAQAARTSLTSIPTGYTNLDAALHIGGIPVGHITLLRGEATAGMTTLAYHITAQAQKKDYVIAYVDCASSFDGEYAGVRCGVTLDKLLLIQPEKFLQALDITQDLLLLPYRGLVVFDAGVSPAPLAALVTLVERSRITLRRIGWTLLILLSPTSVPEINRFIHVHLSIERLAWITDLQADFGYRACAHVIKNTLHSGSGYAEIEILVEG